MSENIEVPKEVVEKFNEINLQRKKNNYRLLKYIAMDYNNEWYGYFKKPTIEGGEWSFGEDCELLCISDNNWENSLTEMPLEDI